MVRLDEKFGKVVDQPVPDWFVRGLHEFAVRRGAARPITSRRLDGLFDRLKKAYDWADKQQVSTHTLRHHAITMVERSSSGSTAATTHCSTADRVWPRRHGLGATAVARMLTYSPAGALLNTGSSTAATLVNWSSRSASLMSSRPSLRRQAAHFACASAP